MRCLYFVIVFFLSFFVKSQAKENPWIQGTKIKICVSGQNRYIDLKILEDKRFENSILHRFLSNPDTQDLTADGFIFIMANVNLFDRYIWQWIQRGFVHFSSVADAIDCKVEADYLGILPLSNELLEYIKKKSYEEDFQAHEYIEKLVISLVEQDVHKAHEREYFQLSHSKSIDQQFTYNLKRQKDNLTLHSRNYAGNPIAEMNYAINVYCDIIDNYNNHLDEASRRNIIFCAEKSHFDGTATTCVDLETGNSIFSEHYEKNLKPLCVGRFIVFVCPYVTIYFDCVDRIIWKRVRGNENLLKIKNTIYVEYYLVLN